MAKRAKSIAKQSLGTEKVKISRINLSGNPLGLRLSPQIARKKPVLKITFGKSKLLGVKMVVRNPEELGIIASGKMVGEQFFEKGENVFRIHIDSSSAADIVRLLNALEENFSKLKKAGITCFYGFSPNHSLLNYFKRRFSRYSHTDIEVPAKEQAWELKNYLAGVKKKGFAKKYVGQEVKGIAIRF